MNIFVSYAHCIGRARRVGQINSGKITAGISAKDKSACHTFIFRVTMSVYGDLIARFLRGDFGSIDEVHPQLVASPFAEDRHGAVSKF